MIGAPISAIGVGPGRDRDRRGPRPARLTAAGADGPMPRPVHDGAAIDADWSLRRRETSEPVRRSPSQRRTAPIADRVLRRSGSTGRRITATPRASGYAPSMPAVSGPAAGRPPAHPRRCRLRLADRRRRCDDRGHRERHRSTPSTPASTGSGADTSARLRRRASGRAATSTRSASPARRCTTAGTTRSMSRSSSAAPPRHRLYSLTLATGVVNWIPEPGPARRRDESRCRNAVRSRSPAGGCGCRSAA